uniref:Uncharacterized protein n=1 Tax=Meloidogyne hapla TaxID=6305 RepID=A0A1I8B522_MELHA
MLECIEFEGVNCNTKFQFVRAFKCYHSVDHLTNNKTRGCKIKDGRKMISMINRKWGYQLDEAKCFLAIEFKGKPSGNEKEALQKYTKQGCGDCPSNAGFCRTCTESLCNSKEFYEEMQYCWKSKTETEQCIRKENEGICYYAVESNGKVKQACGKCPPKEKGACQECTKTYCNKESLVGYYCYSRDGKVCLTAYNGACYTARNKDNEVVQGCGNCPNPACKKCFGQFCNDAKNFKYYCLYPHFNVLNECDEPECYIARGDKDFD